MVFHVDVHSVKPVGNALNDDAGLARPDVVASDREGNSCAARRHRPVGA